MIKKFLVDVDGNPLAGAYERVEATCDSCKSDLVWRDGRTQNVNSMTLKPSFGYGSPIDGLGLERRVEFHVCDQCTAKALSFLNLTHLLHKEDAQAIFGVLGILKKL